MDGRETEDKFAKVRERMLKWDLVGRDITDPDVLKVMSEIRREEFVPESHQSQAYDDGPLPIGMGQTISQPYIVALMTQELRLNADCEVLEIGTGSGYQTAILSKLAKKVYTVERFAELSESAQAVLGQLGVGNVEMLNFMLATAVAAGRRKKALTGLWLRQRCRRCRRPCSNNWLKAA
jgi:protein-L-isoaspartate(D-aspartate) O-methyltransferase